MITPSYTPAALSSTFFIDSASEDVQGFVDRALAPVGTQASARKKAVALFYAVRDQIRYDPYRISMSAEAFTASSVVKAGYGWCVPKAVLLSACARAVGIPATIGLADVKNHLNTARLREAMGGTDVFYDHGYSALWIEGRWVKAVPAFNIELCERFGVLPTEFDGAGDALYQPYNSLKQLHMEYIADHGTFEDLPLQRILEDFAKHYPASLMKPQPTAADNAPNADFAADGEREREPRR
jgi:transglutaminase-like putative cysteine protease